MMALAAGTQLSLHFLLADLAGENMKTLQL